MEMPTFQIPHDFFKNTGWPSNKVHATFFNKLSWQLSIWYPFALLKIGQFMNNQCLISYARVNNLPYSNGQ